MAKSKRHYDLRAFREAIEAHGASVSAVARAVGCSRSTVYQYIKKYPELGRAWAGVADSMPEERPQYSREAFMAAVEGSMGIKAAVAKRLGCSRGTVDNAIERWDDVREAFERERSAIVDLATSKLVQALRSDEVDMRAVTFTLETLGKNDGWSKRTEVTGANGGGLLSPDIMALIEAQGLDMSAVVRQFEAMVRAQAEVKR